MASIILRSNNVKAVHALGLLCLVLLVQKGAAFSFIVGDQKGWSVPSDPNSNPYNHWAETRRFQNGDSLVFKYQAGQDSVLQVKSEDYAKCNVDAPIAKYSDGYTVFSLNKSGPYYFISGNKDNCNKNEKLVVVVLADRSKNQTISSPPPSASPELAPSPASTAQETPSPSPPPSSSPPTGQETPSSPPSSPPTEQATPSPPSSAPATETPPHNAASSVLVGFAGIGAFMASSLVLSF